MSGEHIEMARVEEQFSLFPGATRVSEPVVSNPGGATKRKPELGPSDDGFWRLLPKPSAQVVATWRRLGLDERLDAVVPNASSWSVEEQFAYGLRLAGLLLVDMEEMFSSHHERDEHGKLTFRDDEDRQDFIALLGWVCGFWNGKIPFRLAAKLFGLDPRKFRDATVEAYANDLHLAEEVFADQFTLH